MGERSERNRRERERDGEREGARGMNEDKGYITRSGLTDFPNISTLFVASFEQKLKTKRKLISQSKLELFF